MAIAAVARASSIVLLARRRARTRWVFNPPTASSFSSSSSSSTPARKLVLYSKPGCCLCDGLKEKLQAAFLLSGPDSLHDIRDITTNPEWERAYQYEIPVLAKVLSDGTEVAIARASLHLYMKGALHDLLVLPSNDGSDG
ncbi:hypothetical protein CJ030_MR7G010719 [Morella rubra]|uniref:Glutaredoxin-like protein n=1 Tax=Morella rubra TaxID=262757 RepID=A0A6A1V257_9ROSI|nr:hypothetical protein CJ030_MR7G010719 [Morella rubra]